MTRFIRLIGILLLYFQAPRALSQTVIETFVTTDNITVESWWNRFLDDQKRFSLFNLSEAVYDFDQEASLFTTYTVVGYDWKKGFGPLVGSRFLPDRASFLAGLQYIFYNERLLTTFNLTSEIRDDPFFELFSILQYRVPLSAKISLFSQLQISNNFNSDQHDFSFQRLRVGIERSIWQFGIGLNQEQFGSQLDYEAAPGIFIRLALP